MSLWDHKPEVKLACTETKKCNMYNQRLNLIHPFNNILLKVSSSYAFDLDLAQFLNTEDLFINLQVYKHSYQISSS